MGRGGNKTHARQTLEAGENMKQLTEVRRTLEKELGKDACTRIRTPIFILDVLLVLIYPLIAWAAAYLLWTHPTNTLVYWIAAPLSGWCMLSCSLVYHDVCGHRGAFGKWGSWIIGIWVTSGCPMLMKEMNTTWMARHRIHHKNTFEEKDPELFRNSIDTSLMRILCLFGLFRSYVRRRVYSKYNGQLDVRTEFPGALGHEYHFKMQVEKIITSTVYTIWVSLILNGGPVNEFLNSNGFNVPSTSFPAARTLVSAISWFGVFDTIRWLLEHGEQDMENPFWQSTLYVTGFWTRLACTWDSGDCHTVHHIWHDVPIYRMPEAVRLINPIMVKNGVTLRTDFWALVYSYLIVAETHANKWPVSTADKKRK